MEGTAIKAPHTHRFTPVGACIYCGATEGRLTEEHIIPKGLGGTLVLPQASCDACATTTSLFEMRVLRGFLDRGRQAMGIKGRKAHKRALPDTLTQTFIQPDESTVEREVPWNDGIKVMHLPVFVLPAFLDPRKPMDPRVQKLEIMAVDTLHFGVGQGELVREYQAQGVRFDDRLDVWAFAKLLAKIAHGYHVAIHGMFPLQESPLVPIILGQRSDALNWIGNTLEDPLPSGGTALHLLQHLPLEADDGGRGAVVRIKLFATDPTPTYALATRLEAPEGE
ncbi:HNH endonuclease [Luteimonas terricola]|nr:HNH endonuclease [Luteimonas terricola]